MLEGMDSNTHGTQCEKKEQQKDNACEYASQGQSHLAFTYGGLYQPPYTHTHTPQKLKGKCSHSEVALSVSICIGVYVEDSCT